MAPTPMPAAAPVLRDELLLRSAFVVAMEEAGDVEFAVEVVLAEVAGATLDVDVTAIVDEVDDVDGRKSNIVIVCCRSECGAGAWKVSLDEVEHVVSPLQQAHKLLLEL